MASRMTSRRFLSTLIHPLAVNVLDDIGRTLEVVRAGWVKCHGSGLQCLHCVVHRCIFNLSAGLLFLSLVFPPAGGAAD